MLGFVFCGHVTGSHICWVCSHVAGSLIYVGFYGHVTNSQMSGFVVV